MRGELEHGYGTGVHILDDPFLRSLLARLGSPRTQMPEVRALLADVYHGLLGAVLANEFPCAERRVETRMSQFTERGFFEGELLDPGTQVVIACVVRAGVLPSEICLDLLGKVLDPANIRLDYLSMSRCVDANGQVTGTDESGVKIGGPIHDAMLLIPDPMGATGGTVARTLEIYRERDFGTARKTIALPMIATPEFMGNMRTKCPDLTIYTARLDRGLSSAEVLQQAPGTVEGECGLTERQYIVPGAGGLGEILTNSWI